MNNAVYSSTITNDDLSPLFKRLKMPGALVRFTEQSIDPAWSSKSLSQRLHDLLTAEIVRRDNNGLARRLSDAKIRYPDASIEGVWVEGSGMDASFLADLATCDWIRNHKNCIITGKVGSGKTYLACALANAACLHKFSVRFVRFPRFLKQLRTSHTFNAGFDNELKKLRKAHLLVIDDWGLGEIDALVRSDLLEIFEERYQCGSVLLTTLLPVNTWAQYIGDLTYADSILDRVISNAYRIDLQGESRRGTAKGDNK